MRTIDQIYSEYKIMSNLQLHQLRVASVAKVIAENFKGKLDVKSIILTCLFHDMGNIIKSDLSYFPEFRKPEGLEYWQKVKAEYIEKYGSNENVATEKIAKEIGLPPEVMGCLAHIGFSHGIENDKGGSFENKICSYSDMRVGPHGVMSMRDRISEGRNRYKGRKHSISSDNFDSIEKSMENIERQIFEKTNIKPNEITDEKIRKYMDDLKKLMV